MDIKKQMVEAGSKWFATQIDIAVEQNPRLAYISKRLKNGVANILAEKVDMVDPYLPFLTDSNGKFNFNSVGEELLNAFDEMPIRSYEAIGLDVEIGKGRIAIVFPDSIFTSLLLDHNRWVIEREDIMDLINMLQR